MSDNFDRILLQIIRFETLKKRKKEKGKKKNSLNELASFVDRTNNFNQSPLDRRDEIVHDSSVDNVFNLHFGITEQQSIT